MTTEANPKASLYRKIAAVAGAIEAVEKDGKNTDQKYRYPTPASVMTAVKPLMAQQCLAIVPHLVDFHEIDTGQRSGGGKPFILNRVSMHYHILDGETGEELVVPWQAQAGTYGDDKGLAKAQTIALRTFLIQLFQIPAEDPEMDPDARDARPTGDVAYQGRGQQQRPAAARGNAPLGQGHQDAGASYAPPSAAPRQPLAPGVHARPQIARDPQPATRKPPTRLGMLARIQELTEEAVGLDLEIDLAKPLDQMTDDELVQHGRNLGRAVAEAQARDLAPAA